MANGLLRFTASPHRLFTPADQPVGETWVYQVGQPFQLSATEAGMLAHIRYASTRVIDLEVGADLVVFDQVDRITTQRVTPLSRYEIIDHPRTGEKIFMVPATCGGFVPRGAKRADGSPHPHAGTGFALITAMGYPVSLSEQADTHLNIDSDLYSRITLVQLEYDGRSVHVTKRESMEEDELIPGYRISYLALNPMIAGDRDDLVGGISMGTIAASEVGFGRWQRGQDGCWRPVQVVSVTKNNVEPTVIRDVDGSLLMAVRPGFKGHPDGGELAVFRSTDHGATWHNQIRISKFMMGNTPVTLNRAVDGTPFIMTNRHRVPPIHRYAKREMIWAWPLSADRKSVLDPILVRDGQEFGPTPTAGSVWRMDHPNGCPLRLADGQWRCLLSYRVLEDAEMRTHAAPTPFTGLYVEEAISAGPPLPTWRF